MKMQNNNQVRTNCKGQEVEIIRDIKDTIELANATEYTKTKTKSKEEGTSITNEVSSIDSKDEIKTSNEGDSNISL